MDFFSKLGTKAGETFQSIKDSDATKKAKNYAEIPGLTVQVGKQESLVKKAYVYLNRGVELSAGKESEFETLMNRAEVSISVPNSIFGKMEVGARDFERAAELYKLKSESAILSEYDRIYLAYIYASAAECYSELGREVEEALSMKKAEQYFSDSIVPDN